MFAWRRWAALRAIVCSIAACVPTNPAWPSPEPGWQAAEPDESASTTENEGDDVAEEDHADDDPSTEANSDHPASTEWLCTVEGESIYGYDVESGPPSDVRGTSSIHLFGQGKTRSEAEYSAISDCNSIMTVDLSRNGAMNMEPSSEGSWGSAVSSPCRITECIAPARARRGKNSSR